MIFLITCLGALMNHIRGGFLTTLYTKWLIRRFGYSFPVAVNKAERIFKTLGKQLNCFVFALVFTLLIQINQAGFHVIDFAILYLSMIAGQSVGWGSYINGMINKNFSPEAEVKIIDFIVIENIKSPVLANCVALSLRGFMWSFCLFAGFSSIIISSFSDPKGLIWILPVGLLMGPVYLLAMEICQRIPNKVRGNGWQLGECFFGFILWGWPAILMGL